MPKTAKKITHLLMCRPDHFKVAYEINPWMRVTHQPDVKRSIRQWTALYRALRTKAHAHISLMRPVKNCPDLVFTANAGMVVGKQFFSSRFRYPERGREEPHFKKWFRNHGFQVSAVSNQYHFEGEGDLLAVGKQFFLGHRFRSDIRVLRLLEKWMRRRILPLALADKRFYHLDTCFLPLSAKTLLYYPGAFTPSSEKLIKKIVPNAVAVTTEEALRFVLNGVRIDGVLVTNVGCSPKTKAVIRKEGLRLVEVDLSEFHKSGGSAKCLTLYLPARGSENANHGLA